MVSNPVSSATVPSNAATSVHSSNLASKYRDMAFPLCDEVTDKYDKQTKIGHGTFGLVHDEI